MTTQYTPILKLALPVTGELSGTWGTVVNDNITSMVEQAVAGLSTINTWTANAHTLTTADGTSSEARCAMLVLATGAGGTALTAAGEVICPAASKLYVVKNGSAYAVTVKTSAGTGVAIPAGDTAFVFCDGTNVNACVTTIVNGHISGNLTVDGNTTLGDATSDTITATARFNTDLLPSTDNARDLGSTANSWRTLYCETSVIAANITISGNTISSTDTNGNITLAPNGTGDVQLDADTIRVGDSGANVTITSNGAGDLILNTNSGTNSGSITIEDGVNGNIALAPNGTGQVTISTALDLTNLEVTNIKAKDGTASMTLADSTGVVTFSKATVIEATDNTNAALRVTQLGTGNAILVEDSANPDSTPFVVTATGDVGIGTNNPFTKLDVTTSSVIAGTFTGASTAIPGTAGFWNNTVAGLDLYDSAGGSGYGVGVRFRPKNSSSTVAGIAALAPSSTSSALVFHTQDSNSSVPERMRLDSSGNLGIGTDTPVSALGFGQAASATGITFQSTSTTFNSGKAAVIKASISGSGNGALIFETYEGGSGGGERMRLTNTGTLNIVGAGTAGSTQAISFNGSTPVDTLVTTSGGLVGVGTSSPGAKLNTSIAAGSASATNIHYLLSETGTNSDTGMQIKAINSTNSWDAGSITFRREGAADSYGLVFATSSGGTNNNRLFLNSSGNLGLGVTPSAWSSTWKAFQISNRSLAQTGAGAGDLTMVFNGYFDSTDSRWEFQGAGDYAARYSITGAGVHSWHISTAAGANANDPISFTQAMTLDASGNLLVGGTSNAVGARAILENASGNQIGLRYTSVATYYNSVDSSGNLIWTKDGTERARITSGGDLQIANGNLVMSTSGKGIDFSATSSGTGTMTSELLADYEEGTWTPTATFATPGTVSTSLAVGLYTKVGNVVTAVGRIAITKGTASGNLVLGGLPFASNNTTSYQVAGTLSTDTFGVAGTLYQMLLASNSTVPEALAVTQSTGITNAVTASDFYATAGTLRFAFTYQI